MVAIKGRVKGVVGTENTAPSTDLVIEAVFEDFDVKTAVFSTLDDVCEPHTILVSNTSSLSVNALAEATGRPDRFVGLHFFYHPAKNRLVEVIPAATTSAETIERTVQYCKTSKVVIVCADRPGFVVNRFFAPWLNEACLLLEEGVATAAQIDAIACKAFRIGLGPFGLMNLTGPPIALHSTDYLAEQLNTPRYTGAGNLRALVEAGEMWSIENDSAYDEATYAAVSERLLGVVFGVAAQIVEEDVCSMEDVDRGAKVGLAGQGSVRADEPRRPQGGAPHGSGLRRVGRRRVVRARLLHRQAAGGEGWDFSYVDVHMDDGIATITINRPEAMNALNETVVEQLGQAVAKVHAAEGIHTMVLDEQARPSWPVRT